MPTIVRLDQKKYLASGVDLKELFDQIPQPIAYFDANNRLGACNLSFRDAFPVVIESEFLKRASVERYTEQGLARDAKAIVTLANAEHLDGHAASVTIRAASRG